MPHSPKLLRISPLLTSSTLGSTFSFLVSVFSLFLTASLWYYPLSWDLRAWNRVPSGLNQPDTKYIFPSLSLSLFFLQTLAKSLSMLSPTAWPFLCLPLTLVPDLKGSQPCFSSQKTAGFAFCFPVFFFFSQTLLKLSWRFPILNYFIKETTKNPKGNLNSQATSEPVIMLGGSPRTKERERCVKSIGRGLLLNLPEAVAPQHRGSECVDGDPRTQDVM